MTPGWTKSEETMSGIATLKDSRLKLFRLIRFLEEYGDASGEKHFENTLSTIVAELRAARAQISPVLREYDELELKGLEAIETLIKSPHFPKIIHQTIQKSGQ